VPTSEPTEAFVWIWLPEANEPVVAGVLRAEGEYTFTYGQSYLGRGEAMPLYLPELPLRPGVIPPMVGDAPGCIRDACPDGWGQRVIENRLVGRGELPSDGLGLLTYLLESGSDRTGALDFQRSPTEYEARSGGAPSLDDLANAAALVDAGQPLPASLDQALLHGTSIGGARPKAVLNDGHRQLIAKFGSTADRYPVVKAEFVAMELARRAGLDVAPVSVTQALSNDVLLVERFDRTAGGGRRAMVSALTILGLSELEVRYATYPDLADAIRSRFTEPKASLVELFSRITFNVLVGNTDDHGRNHAAFWDGAMLTLTPAYDICPSPRSGGETTQAMAIGRSGYKMSQLVGCVDNASEYFVSRVEARAVIDNQLTVIEATWNEVCDMGGLTQVERTALWGRQFLNDYALYDYVNT
jgi:serine/threonine-protein kinase HipA